MMTGTNTKVVKYSLKKNDEVQVISGREKGKTGKVTKVDLKNGRVTIEKVNMVKKHVKPSQKNPQGGILEQELPLHYSNVQLFCTKCNRGVRHGHKEVTATSKGKKGENSAVGKMVKVRVCKRCDTQIDAA